ncbi:MULTISPECIES: DUF742 domain-containing protein [Streptomyces]|uniref:DUF742 domain-containing protein n=1 Tax=Streptomyces fildesensis TaxID=375757 RepID=A0ABW8C579_9ACTN|nr:MULTISPECIES: DUF742 domain-containing protein [unclassified Streptomyces]MCM2418150.1 DUF742 domain-containing protein [Streptomyces sp. RKAG293]MCM2429678.1 DUF742 domain-containing protein [Streptomyces sp. RKAG337]
MDGRWYDDEAGPMVRPYALTGGRTRGDGGSAHLDLIAQVVAEPGAEPGAAGDPALAPEHGTILALCRTDPLSVAEIAADSDLPVGVVRVLLGDLLTLGWVRVRRPVAPAELPGEHILREVIDGLRAL